MPFRIPFIKTPRETSKADIPPHIHGAPPRVAPPKTDKSGKPPGPEPAESSGSPEAHTVYVTDAATPRVAPPKAWNSRKPPGGKLPDEVELPQNTQPPQLSD